MKKMKLNVLGMAVAGIVISQTSGAYAGSVTQALKTGKAYGDFRLRYESVDQDNALEDASALTLRSMVGYTTGSVEGFSATVEFEDVRIVAGEGDYSVPPTGYKPGEYSVIADPETTELDQGFIEYKTAKTATKLGRQVITMDNHRFIGHVGWRQDRQTFDGFSTTFTPTKELKIQYAFLDQRNRIFAEAADVDSSDHLINVAYTLDAGTLVGYGYLLEDEDTDTTIDTFGARFTGSTMAGDIKVLYSAEFASQSFEKGAAEYDADYMLLEGGAVISGITATLTYEVLGSDDGAYGFSTPLATGHKFNGWADLFLGTPNQGLVDTTLTVGGALGGGNWSVAYHDYEADESSSTVDDLGDEINISYAKAFGPTYYAGIKYAAYSEGDIAAKPDTDKLWVWVGAKF